MTSCFHMPNFLPNQQLMALHRTEVFMGLHYTTMCVCQATAQSDADRCGVTSGIRTRSQTSRLGHQKTCQRKGVSFVPKTGQPKDLYTEFNIHYNRSKIWVSVFSLCLVISCLLWYMVGSNQIKFHCALYVLGTLLPCLLYYLNFVHVRCESIQAVSSIGVQLTTTYTTGRQESHFYDVVEIQDVVINEAVTMHSVIFYLVLLIKDPTHGRLNRVIPVFKHSYPSLDFLVRVYNGVQDVMYPLMSSITSSCEQ